MEVGRNDYCPCGSGKKYKKCCLKNNVVSLEQVRDEELSNLQVELLDFALDEYEDILEDVIDNFLGDQYFDEESETLKLFYLHMWAIFTLPIIFGRTILDEFLEKKKKARNVRTSTLNQLESWKQVGPSFSIVTNVIDDLYFEVEDIFTKEKKTVKRIQDQEKVEEGVLILGFLVPFGNYSSYFILFLDFPKSEVRALVSEAQHHFDESDYSDATEFMKDVFPSLLSAIIEGEFGDLPSIDDFEWKKPEFKTVANLLSKKLEEMELPSEFISVGVYFWSMFCEKESPTVRKPQVYAAAIHYFIEMNLPQLGFFTQQEIADLYGVSVTSVSKVYRRMEEALKQELEKIDEYMENEVDWHSEEFEDIMDEKK